MVLLPTCWSEGHWLLNKLHASIFSNVRVFPQAREKTHDRGPKTYPIFPNTKKTVFTRTFSREVRAHFCLLAFDASQEPNGNCSEKLVQMNFFILGGFFRVDFLLWPKHMAHVGHPPWATHPPLHMGKHGTIMANAKLPNRPGFALPLPPPPSGFPPPKFMCGLFHFFPRHDALKGVIST